MHKITEPLQLAIGSQEAGSGFGCVMNVISWENGDKNITDVPSCSDMSLAMVMAFVNDEYCTHITGIPVGEHTWTDWEGNKKTMPKYVSVLCAECAMKVIDLGHQTVGTELGFYGYTDTEIVGIYRRMARMIRDEVHTYTGLTGPERECLNQEVGYIQRQRKAVQATARRLEELFENWVNLRWEHHCIESHKVERGSYENFIFDTAQKFFDVFEDATDITALEVSDEVINEALRKMAVKV